MHHVELQIYRVWLLREKLLPLDVYTSNEPVMSKEIEYKGMLLVSKVKSRNMFSGIGSGVVSKCCG